MKRRNLAILVSGVIYCLSSEVIADYTELTTRTNINKREPLFNSSVEDYQTFEQAIEDNKNSAARGIASKEGFSELVSHEQAATMADDLSKIPAGQLADQGRETLAREPDLNDYFVDYSKPGMMEHKKDAEIIATATGVLLDNLVSRLKELGVDCKTVKGNQEIEPQYFIELNKQQHRNTIYDQLFCEQLHNKYRCVDQLTLQCSELTEGAASITINDVSVSGYGRNNGPGAFIRNPTINWHHIDKYLEINSKVGDVRGWHVDPDGPFWSALLDISINITVADEQKDLTSFVIESLNFAGNVMITVNEQLVLNYPAGGEVLNPIGSLQWLRTGSREQGFEMVAIGGGRTFVVWWDQDDRLGVHGGASCRSLTNIDLRAFIRQGTNLISIKQVSSIHANNNMRIRIGRRTCANWREQWNELCRLN